MGGGGGKGGGKGGGGYSSSAAQIAAYEKQQQELYKRMDAQSAQQKLELEQLRTDQQLQLKTQQEDLAKQRQEAHMADQRDLRDSLYSDRVSAEQTATDYINSQIRQEQSNAAVYGMGYELSDEAKSKRISEYFSGIWNKTDDDRLNNLFKEVGKPDNFADFTVNISETASGTTPSTSSVNVVSTSKGEKPKPRPTKSLDSLMSPSSTLDSLLGG